MEDRRMKKTVTAFLIAIVVTFAFGVGCVEATAPPSDSLTSDTSRQPGQGDTSSGTSPGSTGGIGDGSTRKSIRIGLSRPITGIFQSFEQDTFGPVYRMWRDQVNAEGGIYVAEYGRRLPVEFIVLDDYSDMQMMIRNTERLMLEMHVDFMFPSCSTGFLFAQAELTNRHGFMLFGAEGGASELAASYERYPLFFGTANHSVTQIPALGEILQEAGISTVFIVYINDLHGTEYASASTTIFQTFGIDIVGMSTIPRNLQDFTTIFNQAKASGAQAYLQFAYPGENIPAVVQAAEMGFNPEVMLFGPGVGMDSFIFEVGVEIAHGIMAWGAFNDSHPGAADWIERFKRHVIEVEGRTPNMDWWGHLPFAAVLQVFQQAVEGAGTLNNAEVAQFMKDNTFETVMGTIWYENNQIAAEAFLGNVGQWQYGRFEVIDVGRNRTANPIIPKPNWPN